MCCVLPHQMDVSRNLTRRTHTWHAGTWGGRHGVEWQVLLVWGGQERRDLQALEPHVCPPHVCSAPSDSTADGAVCLKHTYAEMKLFAQGTCLKLPMRSVSCAVLMLQGRRWLHKGAGDWGQGLLIS